MKLIIQVPCFNEEDNIEAVIKGLPLSIEGIDEIEILVINDGSSDKTVEIATKLGAKVLSHSHNLGLAASFKSGIKECLRRNADIIVNTDGDNQYNGADVIALVKPILDGSADMVIGARDIRNHKEFSPIKKLLQIFGSWVVRIISSSSVEDAPSGFRAFSKECASRINIFDNFSYTMETIIQATAKGFRIKSVPIRVNPRTRHSRLFKNSFHYVFRTSCTILRMFAIYRPFRFFTILATIPFLSGISLIFRYLYFFVTGDGNGHIQSLLLASILIFIGVLIQVIAIFADLISINRKLLEDIQAKLYKN